MASEEESSEMSSLFDRLVRDRDFSVFVPLMFVFALRNPSPDRDEGAEAEAERGAERIVLINMIGESMTMIEGTSSLEDLIEDMAGKEGQPPASKAAMEAMPSVEIGGDGGAECAICLEEWKVGGVAKEMPCKHRFHGDCIDKWLGIHGSCPVCRYAMPVDEEEGRKRVRDSDDDSEEEGRQRRFTRISFSFNGARTSGPTTSDSTDSSSSQ